jgi:hypothetical protein
MVVRLSDLYSPAALYPQKDSWYSYPWAKARLEGKLKKKNPPHRESETATFGLAA